MKVRFKSVARFLSHLQSQIESGLYLVIRSHRLRPVAIRNHVVWFALLFSLSSGIAQGQIQKTSVAKNKSTLVNVKTSPEVLLFLGDSLAAGYGVRKEEAFPEVVGRRLTQKGFKVQVINASIAGSVTEGSSDRLRYYLKLKPNVLVLELGGNDGLQGTPIAVIKKNLAQTIDLALSNHMKVLLVGMQIYSNFGESYTHDFEKMYAELAQDKHISLLPFLLEGVAMQKELNQSDMKHPNALGHVRVADTVLKSVEPLL